MKEQYQNNYGIVMLDPYKLWEKLYFLNEDMVTDTMRNLVSTEFFGRGMEVFLNLYLQLINIQNAIISSCMEDSPFPSKKDISRVAGMIISLENKVDRMEITLEDHIDAAEEYQQVPGNNAYGEQITQILLDTIEAMLMMERRISDLENLVRSNNNLLTELTALSPKKLNSPQAAARESLTGEQLGPRYGDHGQ